MSSFRPICGTVLLFLFLPTANAQSRLERLQHSDLLKIDASVPAYYPSGYESQARRSQASLEAGVHWMERQLGVHRPVQLVMLDESHWHTFTGYPYPLPCSDSRQALIFLPVTIGDLGAGLALPTELKSDFMMFHEAGHIYAHAAQLDNANDALTDLYADLLATAYTRSSRSDLSAVLHIPVPAPRSQPYTRLDDWNLLSDDLDMKNFDWFELQLVRLASWVTLHHSLQDLTPKLRASFPENEIVLSKEIGDRFEVMTPGFRDFAGELLLPTTLTKAKLRPCQGNLLREGHIPVLLLNRTKTDIQIRALKGQNFVVKPGWEKLHGKAGQELGLSENTCAVVGGAPTLVVFN